MLVGADHFMAPLVILTERVTIPKRVFLRNAGRYPRLTAARRRQLLGGHTHVREIHILHGITPTRPDTTLRSCSWASSAYQFNGPSPLLSVEPQSLGLEQPERFR